MVNTTNAITAQAGIFTTSKRQITVIFSKWEIGHVPELQITVTQLSKLN